MLETSWLRSSQLGLDTCDSCGKTLYNLTTLPGGPCHESGNCHGSASLGIDHVAWDGGSFPQVGCPIKYLGFTIYSHVLRCLLGEPNCRRGAQICCKRSRLWFSGFPDSNHNVKRFVLNLRESTSQDRMNPSIIKCHQRSVQMNYTKTCRKLYGKRRTSTVKKGKMKQDDQSRVINLSCPSESQRTYCVQGVPLPLSGLDRSTLPQKGPAAMGTQKESGNSEPPGYRQSCSDKLLL